MSSPIYPTRHRSLDPSCFLIYPTPPPRIDHETMWHNRRQKRPEEYSTNPNTIRARRRKARLSPYSKEVEQAKASDSKAVTRAWKQHVETDTYKMSSEDERKSILENVEKEVMDRRFVFCLPYLWDH